MRVSIVLAFAIFLVCHTFAAGAAEPPAAEALGTLPRVSDVVLSPSGNLIAWQDSSKGATVVMFDLGARKYRRAVPLDKSVKLRSLAWADDETLLITVSVFATYGETNASSHYEVFRTFAADVGGGKDRMLLMNGGARALVTGADLLAWRTKKPKTVIMSTWDYSAASARMETGTRLAGHRGDSGWIAEVFEVDLRTGNGKRIEEGTAFTDDWVVDKDGAVVARSEWNPKTELYTVLAKNGSGWRELLRQEHQGERTLYGLTEDGAAIVISATNEQGRERLDALPLDGSARRVLLDDPTYGVSSVVHDRFTRAPVSAVLGGPEEPVRWFDADAEKQTKSVAAAFPGKTVYVYGRSEDGKRVIAEAESPSSPPVYYLVDFNTHKADIVGEAYPALTGVQLGEVRAITYKARDGAEVPAYLTLPPGSAGKNLPLVLLPHGGPEARDSFAFDWFAQFLATRGYAVLQPQFRGSTGFGDAWRKAGYRQWGRLMQDDLTDGVKALIDQGVADAGRVCVVGLSYGGYAALAGAAFTPDLYRCAVSINGVSDLPRMLGYENEHTGEESDTLAYWRDHIGPPFDPQVIAKSPARAAEQVTAPVLLVHSVNDTVVPISQSEAMSRALGAAGKKVTLVKLDGEDHWLSQSATRVQVLKETERFLDTYLHGAPASSPSQN